MTLTYIYFQKCTYKPLSSFPYYCSQTSCIPRKQNVIDEIGLRCQIVFVFAEDWLKPLSKHVPYWLILLVVLLSPFRLNSGYELGHGSSIHFRTIPIDLLFSIYIYWYHHKINHTKNTAHLTYIFNALVSTLYQGLASGQLHVHCSFNLSRYVPKFSMALTAISYNSMW
jgi:hypothetical protein